jgi:hypothetical protein
MRRTQLYPLNPGVTQFEIELHRLHSACVGLNRSRVASSREGVDCHAGVWHHVPLIPAHAPGHGDDHDVENCGARGTTYHQEFLLLRMPHPGIQDEQGTVLRPRDDTEC